MDYDKTTNSQPIQDNFVHLHVHSQFSLLDGACTIKKLVAKAKSLGQGAVAVTDHGVMNGVIELYKTAKEAGIKPILGCEVYVAPRRMTDKVFKIDNHPHHLVLLCKNNIGYKNLIKLCSQGHITGFYAKPRVDKPLLESHCEGIIALSACLAGEIPQALLQNNYQKAKETALYYQRVFGKGNYYIEIQNHQIPEQISILPDLFKLSEETGIPLVATNDAHYINKEDHQSQHILMCIQTNKTIYEKGGMEFSTNEFFIKSRYEMEKSFSSFNDFFGNKIKSALDNTSVIAQMCNVSFEFGNLILPKFTAPQQMKNEDYFLDICNRGIKRHYGENPAPEILQRLNYEIGVIKKMGYIDFYLITYDFINYAKKNGIAVGPGRGSGAGSIAAYAMGITGVDPIKYNLLFERFLNPERVSMPDFDIDFCYENRQRVIDYVTEKYGSDKVCQIITFGTMAARAVIRDVGRVMGLPYALCDKISKLIPREIGITIDKALATNPDFKAEYDNDPKVHELVDNARALEGMPRHASTHAAGVVITPLPIEAYVPLQKNDEAVVTQFTKETVEELGLLKIDFLGLRTLTVIDKTVLWAKNQDPQFNLDTINFDDKNIYKMLSKGDSNCVFQFESDGMKRVLTQLRPETIEDLIAVISLYRPGPMDSIPKYIKNRHSKNAIEYKHPLLKPILEVTYGCIVYQEQVMQICRSLAGFSYGRADLVRRAMAKKKSYIMENERNNFIHGLKDDNDNVVVKGCIANGVSEAIANDIYDEMSGFASYAFNKSHAAGYAVVAYETAYLKYYYPGYFMAAMLTTYLEDTSKVATYIQECKRLSIAVLPPNVNESEEGFVATKTTIRFGLLAVKNIGKGFISNLVAERNRNGYFADIHDFCNRMYDKDINKRAVESMIKSGAFDNMGYNRRQMLMAYENILQSLGNTARNNVLGQMSMFDSPEMTQSTKIQIPNLTEFSDWEKLTMEKETTGLYLSGHPMDKYEGLPESLGCVKLNRLTKETDFNDGDRVSIVALIEAKNVKTTKSGENMAFVTVEDWYNSMEMIVFPNALEKFQLLLQPDNVVVVSGKLSFRDDEDPKIIPTDIISADSINLSPASANFSHMHKQKKLYLKLKSNQEFDIISPILKSNNGTMQVYVFYENTEKYLLSPKKYWIKNTVETIEKLTAALGDKCVIIK